MRKLTILLALAAITASSGCSNCCCLGRVRNWFHKGSPCGTTVAPAVLGAPLAMGTPLAQPVSAPAQPIFASPTMAPQMYVEQPAMCYPCPPCDPCANPCVDPCADPCSGAVSMGYMGGYASDAACCGDASTMSGAVITPAPTAPVGSESFQASPTPLAE
ncbi:MAG TPA: hypothetical protein VF175_13435 [Lacipirellula sp.]